MVHGPLVSDDRLRKFHIKSNNTTDIGNRIEQDGFIVMHAKDSD